MPLLRYEKRIKLGTVLSNKVLGACLLIQSRNLAQFGVMRTYVHKGGSGSRMFPPVHCRRVRLDDI